MVKKYFFADLFLRLNEIYCQLSVLENSEWKSNSKKRYTVYSDTEFDSSDSTILCQLQCCLHFRDQSVPIILQNDTRILLGYDNICISLLEP